MHLFCNPEFDYRQYRDALKRSPPDRVIPVWSLLLREVQTLEDGLALIEDPKAKFKVAMRIRNSLELVTRAKELDSEIYTEVKRDESLENFRDHPLSHELLDVIASTIAGIQ